MTSSILFVYHLAWGAFFVLVVTAFRAAAVATETTTERDATGVSRSTNTFDVGKFLSTWGILAASGVGLVLIAMLLWSTHGSMVEHGYIPRFGS